MFSQRFWKEKMKRQYFCAAQQSLSNETGRKGRWLPGKWSKAKSSFKQEDTWSESCSHVGNEASLIPGGDKQCWRQRAQKSFLMWKGQCQHGKATKAHEGSGNLLPALGSLHLHSCIPWVNHISKTPATQPMLSVNPCQHQPAMLRGT